MRQEKLKAEFLRLCKSKLELGAPLGTEAGREKKVITFSLLYRTAKVQLVYRPGTVAATLVSTLYCRVYPDKNSPLYLHLPQLLPLLGVEDYRACYFPYIESAARMESCICALGAILNPLIPVLEELGASGGDRAVLETWIRGTKLVDGAPEDVLRQNSDQQKLFLWLLNSQEDSWIIRYTEFGPWRRYLFGEPGKALGQYRKKKDLTDYELGLCAFLETKEGKKFLPMPPECFAQKDLVELSAGKDDIGTIAKCSLVVYAVCAPVACLIMGLIQLISSWGTVCWFGAPWWSGLVFAALPPIVGGIALRRQIIPLISGEKARRKLEFDDITNDTPFLRWLAAVVFALFVGAAIFFGIMSSCDTMRLYETYGQYTPDMFIFEEFQYSQITDIYYVEVQHNEDGDQIDRPYYVIALEDGTLIDLDGYASVRETEEKVLPLLEPYGVKITHLSSDYDLPDR